MGHTNPEEGTTSPLESSDTRKQLLNNVLVLRLVLRGGIGICACQEGMGMMVPASRPSGEEHPKVWPCSALCSPYLYGGLHPNVGSY